MKKYFPHIIFLAFLMLLPCVLGAQNNKVVQNRPYIDQRPFHYGFLAGIHLQDMEFDNNGLIDADGNEWYTDIASYEPGFSVGILGEVLINKYLSFRVVPSMHFGTKQVTFLNHKDGAKDHQTIKSTYISLPLDLKISGMRVNNYRPYVMLGIDPMMDLTVKKNKTQVSSLDNLAYIYGKDPSGSDIPQTEEMRDNDRVNLTGTYDYRKNNDPGNKNRTSKTGSAGKTGDQTPIGIWLLILCGAGIGILMMVQRKMKKKE